MGREVLNLLVKFKFLDVAKDRVHSVFVNTEARTVVAKQVVAYAPNIGKVIANTLHEFHDFDHAACERAVDAKDLFLVVVGGKENVNSCDKQAHWFEILMTTSESSIKFHKRKLKPPAGKLALSALYKA